MEGHRWKRYSFLVLAHLAFAIMFMQRLNLSIALVAMVGYGSQTHIANDRNERSTPRDTEFDWDEAHQGMLLSAFFYGYVPLNIPGGVLVGKYGGKIVGGVGLVLSSLFTLLTPIAAFNSFTLAMMVRVCVGVCQGVMYPALLALLRKWSPIGGTNRMIAVASAGAETGAVLAFLLGGILCASKFLDGWPTVFFTFGVAGIFWFIAWTVLVAETPGCNEEEAKPLQPLLEDKRTEKNCPWVKILFSIPLWSITVGIFCQDWIWFFIITDLPLFYKHVLGISVMENGLFSTLPIVLAMLTHTASGFLSDYLLQKWSIRSTRRFTASIGFFPTALLLIVVSYTKEGENVQAIVYMTLLAGALRLNRVTFMSNIIDISPTYTGVLMGISNTFGVTAGIGAPLVTGYFTNHDPSRENYRVVFFINAGICVFGGLFFSAFVSGDVQEWDSACKMKEKDIGLHKQ